MKDTIIGKLEGRRDELMGLTTRQEAVIGSQKEAMYGAEAEIARLHRVGPHILSAALCLETSCLKLHGIL